MSNNRIDFNDIETAVANGKFESATKLIEAAELDVKELAILFDIAVSNEQIELIRYFVTHGVSVNTFISTNMPAIEDAVINGKTKLLDYLIDECAVDLNYKNKYGQTLIDLAISYDQPSILEKLVNSGLMPKMKGAATSPYNEAFKLEHFDIIEKLLELEVDPNIVDRTHNNALHYASKNGRIDFIKKFVERGGDLKAQNREGKLPLHYAIENGHTDIAKFLIESGSSLHVHDKYGNNALHTAAQQSSHELTLFIIKQTNYKELLSMENYLHQTPLEASADRGSVANFNLLMTLYETKDEKLRDLCEIAAKQGHIKFIERIIKQYSIHLESDSFAYQLINHPNREYIEKMSMQFNQGFGSMRKDGGVLSFARIKEKRESHGEVFEGCIVNTIKEFRGLLKSALDRAKILPEQKTNLRIGLATQTHWTYCDIEINKENVDICFIDSLGKGGAIEGFLPIIFELAPNADVSEVFEKRQNSEAGCSVMVVDDAEHASIADKKLPPAYKEIGLHGYLKQNSHPSKEVIYKNDFDDTVQYKVRQVYLPLYLARTWQSTTSTAKSGDDVVTQNKNIMWVARAKADELEHPINKAGKMPHESVGEHIYELNDYRSNQRLEHKMRRQCIKNIEFMLNHDKTSLQEALSRVTVSEFIKETERLVQLADIEKQSKLEF